MKVRRMTARDLSTVLEWAAAEGWNPGRDDAKAFHAADPNGFFLAEVDGAPAASISVVNHTEDMAFLGLYICRPAYRGQGVGFALWEDAIRHAGDRTVGLDGVPDQQANYARSGFVRSGETRRFEGALTGVADRDVRVADAGDVAELTAREAAAFGFAKPRLSAHWFAPGETRRTFVLPTAFATVRACLEGHKVGPLVADDLEAAVRLIQHIAAQVDGKVVIDVPDGSETLAEWCAAEGMTVSFGTARMYRGTPPVTGNGVFSAATLELG